MDTAADPGTEQLSEALEKATATARRAAMELEALRAENSNLRCRNRLLSTSEFLLQQRFPRLSAATLQTTVGNIQRVVRRFLRNKRERERYAATTIQAAVRARVAGKRRGHLQEQSRVWRPVEQLLRAYCEGSRPLPEYWACGWAEIPPPETKYEMLPSAVDSLESGDCADLLDKGSAAAAEHASEMVEPATDGCGGSANGYIGAAANGCIGAAAEGCLDPDAEMEVWQQAHKWIEHRSNREQIASRVLASIRSGNRG